jgi:hypothetical protein
MEMLSPLKRAFRAPQNDAQSEREKAAYREGYKIADACEEGPPRNPYPRGSRMAQSWQQGHDDAIHAQVSAW